MINARGMSFFLFLLISFNLFAATGPALETQRANFKKAERWIASQSWDEYEKVRKSLETYPLFPYLEYQILVKKIHISRRHPDQAVSFGHIEAFAQKYPKLPLLNRLLYKWLHVTAKQKNWEDFLNGYALRNHEFYATSIHCLNVYAQYQTTSDPKVLKEGLPLWREGKSQPYSCNALFKTMRKHNVIQQKHIVERWFLASQNRHLKLAQYLGTLLPKSAHEEAYFWNSLIKSPHKIKTDESFTFIKKAQWCDPMLEAVFYRLARTDLELAQQQWLKLNKHVTLPAKTHANILQDIAVRMAHKKDPLALKWLNDIPHAYLNQVAHEWLVRLSLMKGEWKKVISYIDTMPSKEKQAPEWQYWRARALIQLGYSQRGRDHLNTLSHQRSYYGFLASEWLQKPYTLEDKTLKIPAQSLQQLSHDPAIARVHEWVALERVVDARREWGRYTQSLDEENKILAAYYAHSHQWHDLAIFTMTQTNFKDDLKLRFPLGFAQSIHKHAKLQSLDPAWVFALTRQESAFSHHVRSPVGATGLMQLMPKTAQYIAQKKQLPSPRAVDLVNPDLNVALGTTYLKYLSETLDNQVVLVTASYNAGINRIKTWIPAEPLASDIWIETMPFAETRDYVKNILAYMGIYKSLMGEPFRLSTVMLPVTLPVDSDSAFE